MPVTKSRLIQRKKLSDEVFEQLLNMIREEDLQPGDQMPPERELMTLFGVGRPVVREAMQRLSGMGMITIRHGERACIERIDMHSMIEQIDVAARHMLSSSSKNIDHLLEARIFFESGLARMAAEKANAIDLTRLKVALKAMHDAVENDDFVMADMAFHQEVARISGNPIYLAVSQAVFQWMSDYRQEMLRFKTREVTLQEHENIYRSITERDPLAAEKAMCDHLNNVLEDKNS
ncbi:transcriptional regulator NanR [Budvicia aquatica]|uniref:L-lactate utilization operon repressor n=1 Tax=Budvicia aquatica TaxID=82979 RepID=A0A2C6DT11_9GAMM|nr:transcriptional regulator NanR [Budvicia aquatica]PHI31964.1 transcriptional regulator NanR [Budvicia aquatica]VFS53000.1 L-lactate utilization operon repressor [Budvicia aquatica]